MTVSPQESPELGSPTGPGSGAPPGGWRNPRGSFTFFFLFAIAATAGALLSDAILTLALKADRIDAQRATTILSIVVAVGGLCSLVAFPLIGRLSDRSTSRLGRRRPFLLAAAVLIAAGSLLIVAATDVLMLTVAYTVVGTGAVAAMVATSAIVPDQFEPDRRGTPSSMVGLGSPIGAVLGLFLAQLVQPHLTAMILLPAGVAVLALLLLTAVLKDRPQSPQERPPFVLREFLGTFWVSPRRYPSFALAWASRLFIFFGVAAVNAYQAFYLIDVQHVDTATVGTTIFLATLILTVVSLIFAPVAGQISDRIGRRKPFVVVAALIFAIGLGLVAAAPSIPAFFLAIAVMGLGQGVYFAVDFALITEVLPDPANPGKDIGIMSLANNLPVMIVPAVAPALLAIGASTATPQNFVVLFAAGAIAAVISAVFILPIRGVR
ncbi:MFS transporter [Actinoplanes sp. L3-i22]|uniref:MFS transporter n=1 Tax=Actinoplanes sp. L3-i22 TaxID=2836373 RepID=UPI001C764F79|nr:MFS transporter [Actinoplanes sp. L3-i22]BCY09162.1 MFS transporter [Actinoplanes sp. L3-i22]